MHWETKKCVTHFIVTFTLLYGLEPNPQCVQGMPVLVKYTRLPYRFKKNYILKGQRFNPINCFLNDFYI